MRRYLLIAAGFAAALAVGFVAWEQQQATTFFAETLNRADADELVSIDGVQYSVSNGTVYQNAAAYHGPETGPALRLAYEEAAARRDPPLSLAGTDPAKLLSAVSQLQATQQGLASIQQSATGTSLVRTALYPIGFLTAAATLEEARQAFLASGTQTDADAYQSQLLKTIAIYEADVASFRSAFEQAVPENVGEYATADDVVTRDGVLDALQALSNDANAVQWNARKEAWCLDGFVQLCDPADLEFPLPQARPATPVTAAQLALSDDIRSIYSSAGVALAPFEIELEQSLCAPGAAALFSISSDKTQADWTGDIRFVRADLYPTTAFFRDFLDEGVQLVPAPPLSYYQCVNANTDWDDLFAVQEVAEFSQTTPLSAYADASDASTLQSLERSLASPLVTQQDAIAYVRGGESLAEQGRLPTPVENNLISLSLAMKNGSAGFDLFVAQIARIESINTTLAQEGRGVDLDAGYLFFVRNGFVPLFFGNNGSFNSSGNLFPSDNVPASEQPYVLYSTLPQTGETRTEAVDGIRSFYLLHYGLALP